VDGRKTIVEFGTIWRGGYGKPTKDNKSLKPWIRKRERGHTKGKIGLKGVRVEPSGRIAGEKGMSTMKLTLKKKKRTGLGRKEGAKGGEKTTSDSSQQGGKKKGEKEKKGAGKGGVVGRS